MQIQEVAYDSIENIVEKRGNAVQPWFSSIAAMCFKGGFLDFSHLTELKRKYIPLKFT